MTEEIWKDIEGYEGIYQVSNLGRVKALPRTVEGHNQHGKWTRTEPAKIMAQKLQNTDRYQVSLRDADGKRTTFYVHRLVAMAFVPGYFEGATVNHKNEDHHDNRAENLEWMTKAENNAYGTHNFRVGKSLRMSVEMLTDEGQHVAYFDSIKQGYIVDLGVLGKLYPAVNGKWDENADNLQLADMKPKVNYKAGDDIAAAVKGASLSWTTEAETDENTVTDDDNTQTGGNTGGGNTPGGELEG